VCALGGEEARRAPMMPRRVGGTVREKVAAGDTGSRTVAGCSRHNVTGCLRVTSNPFVARQVLPRSEAAEKVE